MFYSMQYTDRCVLLVSLVLWISKTFSTNDYDFVAKIVAFWTVFWDKGDYIGVWMIEIMIKTNQIDIDVSFLQK